MPSFGAATPASNDKTNQTQEKSGDDPESDDQDSESQQAELPRISPVIERIPFDPAQIDTEDFEIILFAGLMSVEDFGANPVFGGRFAYHASEDFFLEAQYGQTTTDPTSAETLSSLQLLTDDQRDLSYYTMSLGYNVLPSEAYLGRKFAFRSALYVLAGAGSTSFAGENHFTVSFGAGYRFLINDWIAVHLTMQDNMFDSELSGEKKTTQNLQFQLGLSGFF
ncbi:MAG: outer membrane beta-barrel domain-containing protein [Gammaproteobacteria bacterium]|nr:MAG: outer membrane beta-barrel domain-containing protein [Gammaproteobacteria bacterium]